MSIYRIQDHALDAAKAQADSVSLRSRRVHNSTVKKLLTCAESLISETVHYADSVGLSSTLPVAPLGERSAGAGRPLTASHEERIPFPANEDQTCFHAHGRAATPRVLRSSSRAHHSPRFGPETQQDPSTYRRPFDLIARRAKTRNGAPGMTRTCDLLVRSQTLYPTELRARAVRLFELTTASAPSPIWKRLRQFLAAGARTGAPLMICHTMT
jgi:hypothetical protein